MVQRFQPKASHPEEVQPAESTEELQDSGSQRQSPHENSGDAEKPEAPLSVETIEQVKDGHDMDAIDAIHTGVAKLNVAADASTERMMEFLAYLRSDARFHSTEMAGRFGMATIWLAIHRPVQLKAVLLELDCVTSVRVSLPAGPREPTVRELTVFDVVLAHG